MTPPAASFEASTASSRSCFSVDASRVELAERDRVLAQLSCPDAVSWQRNSGIRGPAECKESSYRGHHVGIAEARSIGARYLTTARSPHLPEFALRRQSPPGRAGTGAVPALRLLTRASDACAEALATPLRPKQQSGVCRRAPPSMREQNWPTSAEAWRDGGPCPLGSAPKGGRCRAPFLRLRMAVPLGVAELALGRLDDAGTVLVLALVAADGLDPRSRRPRRARHGPRRRLARRIRATARRLQGVDSAGDRGAVLVLALVGVDLGQVDLGQLGELVLRSRRR